MSKLKLLIEEINSGVYDDMFVRLYGEGEAIVSYQRKRYIDSLNEFARLYPELNDVSIFSASGRTEVCGNHTDHNNGKTLSAAINLDAIAVVSKTEERLEVHSKGYDADILNINDISYKEEEKNTSKALIKGVCNGLLERSYKCGGFVAYTTSDVLKGSGISSSAAFEVLITTVENYLYNDGKISAVEIAQISQFAENKYFGKPCGLLDQTSSAVGGFITIDFATPKNPIIEKIDVDFSKFNHTLCIVDTGGNHADLTHEYAAIPEEMKKVASYFGKEVLCDVNSSEVVENAKELREKFGDRAVLRALHFINENVRVVAQAEALKKGNFDEFLSLVRASGNSSFKYLQNVYANINPHEQGLSLALCICDEMLKDKGAYRVHGGGFGGTIQAFVPNEQLALFKETLENVFGKGSCKALNIRKDGGILAIK